MKSSEEHADGKQVDTTIELAKLSLTETVITRKDWSLGTKRICDPMW